MHESTASPEPHQASRDYSRGLSDGLLAGAELLREVDTDNYLRLTPRDLRRILDELAAELALAAGEEAGR